MQSERPLPSPDENTDNSISVITDVVNNTTLNSNINDTKTHRRSRYRQKTSVLVRHGCLHLRRYQLAGARLSIGRCSIHRKSNVQMARKLKAKRDNIKKQLEKRIHHLESIQNNLISEVQNLFLYKQQLEVMYEQTNSNHYLIV